MTSASHCRRLTMLGTSSGMLRKGRHTNGSGECFWNRLSRGSAGLCPGGPGRQSDGFWQMDETGRHHAGGLAPAAACRTGRTPAIRCSAQPAAHATGT